MNCRANQGLLALFFVASWRLSAQVPLGDNFRVNDYTPGFQNEIQLLLDDHERTLALWMDASHSPRRMEARLISASGHLSSETTLVETPAHSLVAVDRSAGGLAAMVYGAGGGTYFQRISVSGALEGPPSRVGASGWAAGDGDVLVREDGSLVLAWQGSNPALVDDPQQIYFRIVGADGAALTPVAKVNVSYGPTQFQPKVDGDAAGNFTITWLAEPEPESLQTKMMIRSYDRDGHPLGLPQPLAVATDGTQHQGDIACGLGGQCVAVWWGYGGPGRGSDIFARLFAPDGTPLSGDILVNQYTPYAQYYPALSMNQAGEFAVSWTSDFQEGYMEIWARLFRPDGTPASDEFHVNQIDPEGSDDLSAIALSDFGSLVVAWENWETADGSNTGLLARRFLRGCLPGSPVLALAQGRYEACARWETPAGAVGSGQPIALREASGGFWFFDPGNFELLIKAIDGCDYNQAVWTFAAGLTNVGVDLSIHDLWTGRTETYWNPPGRTYAPVLDIGSLPVCEGLPPPAVPLSLPAPGRSSGASQTGRCAPDATHLCLQGDRFRVAASWVAFDGSSGDAIAVPLSDDSGLFWFFGPENLELAVKVIDACTEYDRFWVYAAGLTNVAVQLTVVDTESGEEWRYDNPLGAPFPAVLDSQAFSTCAPQ